MKNFEICPKCESKKVNEFTKIKGVFIGFCMFGCSIWLLIIPPIGILGMLVGIIFGVVSLFYYPRFICQDCKYIWKAEKAKKEIIKPIKTVPPETLYQCNSCMFIFDGIKYPNFKWSYLCPNCGKKLSNEDINK